MKKNLICFLLIFLMSGCVVNVNSSINLFSDSTNSSNENSIKPDYNNKTIAFINYYTISSWEAWCDEKQIDLINNTYSSSQYMKFAEEPKVFIPQYYFDDASKEKFVLSIIENNIYNLKDYYEDTDVYDGSSWYLIITFDDNTSFYSSGYAKSPDNAFDIDLACYELFGDYLFGNLPGLWFTPEAITLTCSQINGSSNLYTGSRITNYTWFKLSKNDIDIIEYAKTISTNLDKDYEYKLIIGRPNYHEPFNEVTVIMMNLDGSEIEFVCKGSWFSNISFPLVINKIYKFTATYDFGEVESIFVAKYRE